MLLVGTMFIRYNKKQNKPACVKCKVIRSFILCVIMLMILGFVLGEDASYFRFISPDFAAMVILIGGLLIFLWKIIEHYLSRKSS